jgi:hypothetical protein
LHEFLLPQFAAGVLPNGLTVHGFGEDASGELYALVTNTPANGTGGMVYQFTPVPEPATLALLGVALLACAARLRRATAPRPLRRTPRSRSRVLGGSRKTGSIGLGARSGSSRIRSDTGV